MDCRIEIRPTMMCCRLEFFKCRLEFIPIGRSKFIPTMFVVAWIVGLKPDLRLEISAIFYERKKV